MKVPLALGSLCIAGAGLVCPSPALEGVSRWDSRPGPALVLSL